MALQLIYVDDASPGACGDAGVVYNGSDTLTFSKIIAGTSATLSSTLAVTGNVAVNTNKFTVTAASGNTAVAGTLAVTGAVTLTAGISVGTTLAVTGISTFSEALAMGGTDNAATSGAVAVPITSLYDGYTTNGTAAIAATLADGSAGQMKVITLKTKDTNNMVLTPANLNNGTTITFDASGEYAVLVFDGTAWNVVSTNATVA